MVWVEIMQGVWVKAKAEVEDEVKVEVKAETTGEAAIRAGD